MNKFEKIRKLITVNLDFQKLEGTESSEKILVEIKAIKFLN